MDSVFVVAMTALFVAALGLVAACDRLGVVT